MEASAYHEKGKRMNLSVPSQNVFHGLGALTNRELKKWYKDPFALFMSIIQPVLWIGLFGKAMNIGGLFPGASAMMQQVFGTTDYFSFMAVGMFSFVVVFTTMFSGMSFVWDRRLGFLNKVLSTPVSRTTIIVSKMCAAVIRATSQALVVLLIALALGLRFGPGFHPINLLGVLAVLFLMAGGLSSLFITIAIRTTRWETHMAVMNLLNLPLIFASNALFPIQAMPGWLQVIARANPVSYATEASRQLLLYPADAHKILTDFIFLGVFALVFITAGIVLSWRYLTR
ncbi:MAG: ABC transporter permease [Dehalococcoidales bacterium]|nr:ABC transporter permease [Dehalococcoidales bacterium]